MSPLNLINHDWKEPCSHFPKEVVSTPTSGSTAGVVLTSMIKPASMETGADEWLMVIITPLIMVRLLLELWFGGLY